MNSHKNASKVMLLLLIYLIFISNFIIFLIIKIFPFFQKQENVIFVQMLGSLIFFLIPLIIYSIAKREHLNNILLLKPLSIKNIFIIILLSLFMQPFLQLINAITSLFAENELTDTLIEYLKAPFWQLFLAIAIFPAILEEIVFRGIFIKEYKNCSFWYGVFFSGLFFGIMHLTITQLFYTTIAGMIMAILVKVTGSIWAGILSHFVLNGTQITLAFLSTKVVNDFDSTISSSIQSLNTNIILTNIYLILYSLFWFAVSIPFFASIIYLFIKVNKKNIEIIKQEDIIKKQNNPKIFNIPFIILLIIYFLYMFAYKILYFIIENLIT